MRCVYVLAWLVALVAQPAFAATSPRFQGLEQRVGALVASKPGEYGVAALDLQTGETVSFNGDTAFPMASTVKLAIAATFMDDVDAGRRTLDDKIAGVTAADLIQRMLVHSDNEATDLMLAMLGGPRVVDRWVHAKGLSGIRVDRTIAQLLAARRDLHDMRDSATPVAMLAFLRKLDSGQLVSDSSRAYMLGLMSHCATGSNRIRGLLPPGTHVEHKTGTLNGLTGDVGFITLPDGRRFALALFARGGVNRPTTIAAAARLLYDGFADATTAAPAFSRVIGSQIATYQPARLTAAAATREDPLPTNFLPEDFGTPRAAGAAQSVLAR